MKKNFYFAGNKIFFMILNFLLFFPSILTPIKNNNDNTNNNNTNKEEIKETKNTKEINIKNI